jgi:hypothetical protein
MSHWGKKNTPHTVACTEQSVSHLRMCVGLPSLNLALQKRNVMK